MINRKHLHVLQVISVLLFSLLANYLIGLNFDFNERIDVIALVKFMLLSYSSCTFYFAEIKLEQFASEAKEEFDSEKNLEVKAENSIDMRYFKFYKKKRKSIHLNLFLSLVSGVLFFFIRAIVNSFL